jgi:hypothetical protein
LQVRLLLRVLAATAAAMLGVAQRQEHLVGHRPHRYVVPGAEDVGMANRRRYTDDQLRAAIPAARYWVDVVTALGFPRTRAATDIKLVARRLGLETSHLDRPRTIGRAFNHDGPGRPNNPSSVGSRTEGIVLAALIRAGKVVLLPFGDGHRYDLAVDDGGRLVRIQCKTAFYKDGCVVFRTVSRRRDGTSMGYEGHADAFGVYCPALDKVYVVPLVDAPDREARLRVEPPKRGQVCNVRWAEHYELTPDLPS